MYTLHNLKSGFDSLISLVSKTNKLYVSRGKIKINKWIYRDCWDGSTSPHPPYTLRQTTENWTEHFCNWLITFGFPLQWIKQLILAYNQPYEVNQHYWFNRKKVTSPSLWTMKSLKIRLLSQDKSLKSKGLLASLPSRRNKWVILEFVNIQNKGF